MGHLRRLIPYLHRHRRSYFTGFFFVAIAVSCAVMIPQIFRWTLDALDGDRTSRSIVLRGAGTIVALGLFRGVFMFIGRYFILSSSRRSECELRDDLYGKLTTLSASYYDRNPTGDLTSRAINDVEGVRAMLGPGILTLWSTGILFLTALVILLTRHPTLTALLLIPLGAITILMSFAGPIFRARSQAVQEQLGVVSARAQENFSGSRIVRAFVQEENETERFRKECDAYRGLSIRLARWRALTFVLIFALWELSIAVTLYFGGAAILEDTFTIGAMAEFVGYQLMLLWPMMAFGWVVTMVQRGLACLGRLAVIFDTRPETDDATAVESDGPIEGGIEARGLTFSYASDRPPALLDVSFRVKPGQKVAIVGPTGSGKSTLARLLLRLYPAPDGSLFVDGRDVNEIPLATLRGSIGAVPQDLFLFSDRLRENIAFGKPTGADDEEVRRAADTSRLSADLGQFPDGYDQVIGERGVTLSGGQRQRTALARAIVRNPRILILDDAFSSVDAHTEREIRDRLREFMKGRTSLVITHRLSMITDADWILVLDEGRLVEEGTHEDLAARGGLYSSLWESQRLVEELSKA